MSDLNSQHNLFHLSKCQRASCFTSPRHCQRPPQLQSLIVLLIHLLERSCTLYLKLSSIHDLVASWCKPNFLQPTRVKFRARKICCLKIRSPFFTASSCLSSVCRLRPSPAAWLAGSSAYAKTTRSCEGHVLSSLAGKTPADTM